MRSIKYISCREFINTLRNSRRPGVWLQREKERQIRLGINVYQTFKWVNNKLEPNTTITRKVKNYEQFLY